jgi:hypothetical protein
MKNYGIIGFIIALLSFGTQSSGQIIYSSDSGSKRTGPSFRPLSGRDTFFSIGSEEKPFGGFEAIVAEIVKEGTPLVVKETKYQGALLKVFFRAKLGREGYSVDANGGLSKMLIDNKELPISKMVSNNKEIPLESQTISNGFIASKSLGKVLVFFSSGSDGKCILALTSQQMKKLEGRSTSR